MKREWKATKIRYACSAKFLCLLIFLLLVNGCSSHDKNFSYFDMLDESKRTQGNKRAAEKFWSSVRPVSTLSASHYRLGRHYQQQGEYEKAIGEFSKALRNDRTYCKAYNGIAMSYDALKQCEPAHASYAQAMKCAPDQPYVYNNYACSSLLCGDYAKGVELFLKAEKLAGDNQRIKNNLRLAQTMVEHKSTIGMAAGRLTDMVAEQSLTSAALPESEKTMIDQPVYRLPEETAPPKLSQELLNMTVDAPISDIHPSLLLPAAEEAISQPPDISTINSTPTVVEAIRLVAEKIKRIHPINPSIPTSRPSLNQSTAAIEVSNGNGAAGMAGRSAAFLRDHGFKVSSITNAKHFRFQDSKIFYKEGYLHVAKELAAIIPGAQNLEKVDTVVGKAPIGVKVLLGRNLVDMRFPDRLKGIAVFSGKKSEPLLASNVTVTDTTVHN